MYIFQHGRYESMNFFKNTGFFYERKEQRKKRRMCNKK